MLARAGLRSPGYTLRRGWGAPGRELSDLAGLDLTPISRGPLWSDLSPRLSYQQNGDKSVKNAKEWKSPNLGVRTLWPPPAGRELRNHLLVYNGHRTNWPGVPGHLPGAAAGAAGGRQEGCTRRSTAVTRPDLLEGKLRGLGFL